MNDLDAMRLALDQSRMALGSTAPNPPVGAVVVREGQVIGAGHTQPVGGPHAEVMALRSCQVDPRGATLVVTLEPCGHHGRTPPCVDALLAAGVARVVVGVVDPTEPMRGQSLERLRASGVEVVLGVEADACARSLEGWLSAVRTGFPAVTLKVATSADGSVATASGESQWITSPEARAAGRALRGTHDAILVGIGTVLADDPRLTTRIQGRPDPVPVVLDSRGRFPPGCALDRLGTLVFVGPEVVGNWRATAVQVPLGTGGLDVDAVLLELVRRGLQRVLVEGGAAVARSLLDAGRVHVVEQFVAGVLIPGGRGWVGGPPLHSLAQGGRLVLEDVERVGPDAWLRWRGDACSRA